MTRIDVLNALRTERPLTEAEVREFLRLAYPGVRAAYRRHLYRTDPLWRLTQLKACRETRLRRKLGCSA